MKNRYFIFGIVTALMLAIGGISEAGGESFDASFVGTCTRKTDFSYTGVGPGGYCTVAGKSTLGPYIAQLVFEFNLDGKSCTLPNGHTSVETKAVGEDAVLSFPEKSEQLFLRLDPSVTSIACVGASSAQVNFVVKGGTGRFVGATGTVIKTYQTIGRAPPTPPGKGTFFSFTGTLEGTIEFADGN